MNVGYGVIRVPHLILLDMPCRKDVKIRPADRPQNICSQTVCRSPEQSRALEHGEMIVPRMISS